LIHGHEKKELRKTIRSYFDRLSMNGYVAVLYRLPFALSPSAKLRRALSKRSFSRLQMEGRNGKGVTE